MINILKKGYKTKPKDIIYVTKCGTCGCKFTYQIDDLFYRNFDEYVTCPDCGHNIYMFFKKKYKGDKNE